MPYAHPPLSSYRRGDRAVITLPVHPRNGEIVEVVGYNRTYGELRVRSLPHGVPEIFSNATSLSPVSTCQRPISPIFYSLQT